MDTGIIVTGQPAGSISPVDAQIIVDSLSSLFSITVTGSFTLTQGQRGSRMRYASTASGVATVPANATLPINVNTVYTFCQTGTGQLTVSGAAGVNVISASTTPVVATRAQNSHIWIIQDSANIWIAGGDLA
jgi:hypothetical protein